MVCCLGIVIISSSFSRFLSDWVSEVCLPVYEDWHYNNEKKIVPYANDMQVAKRWSLIVSSSN